MTITNDPQLETVFLLKQHRPFSLTLTCEKQDKSRLNLTGSALRMVIADLKRKGGTVRVTSNATLVSAPDGTARFDVQGDELGLTPGTYDMAITLTTAEGFESSIIEGQVELAYNPDPTVPVDHTGVAAPLSLTATFRDQNRITVRINHHPDSVLLDALALAQQAASAAQIAQAAAEAAAATAGPESAAAAAAAAAAEAAQVAAEAAAQAAQDLLTDTVEGSALDTAVANLVNPGHLTHLELVSLYATLFQEQEGLLPGVGNIGDILVKTGAGTDEVAWQVNPITDTTQDGQLDLAVAALLDAGHAANLELVDQLNQRGAVSPAGGVAGDHLVKTGPGINDRAWAVDPFNDTSQGETLDNAVAAVLNDGHNANLELVEQMAAQVAEGDGGAFIGVVHNDTTDTTPVRRIRSMTQAAYDALGAPDANTLYVIVG